MTTSAILSETWRTSVFEHADILSITTKAIPYEMLEESEAEIEKVTYRQEINFFEYLITRVYAFPLISGGLEPEYTYLVEIRYTREKDAAALNYQKVRDALDTLMETVRTELGADWGGKVDFWSAQESAPAIVQRIVGGIPCWSFILDFAANFRD